MDDVAGALAHAHALKEWHAEGPPIYMLYAKSRRRPAKVRAFAAYAAGLFESTVGKAGG